MGLTLRGLQVSQPGQAIEDARWKRNVTVVREIPDGINRARGEEIIDTDRDNKCR